jgi:hypothetical protein
MTFTKRDQWKERGRRWWLIAAVTVLAAAVVGLALFAFGRGGSKAPSPPSKIKTTR